VVLWHFYVARAAFAAKKKKRKKKKPTMQAMPS
jgi:hypothetical protein